MKISIIVPCYNEQEALPIFYEEITEALNQTGGVTYNYEVLLINDGSKDATLSVIKALAADDTRIKYLSFSRNFGKEAAMYAGFVNADGDCVAVMDADMQDPPDLLPQMIDILINGVKNENGDIEYYDTVATKRVSRSGEPPVRSFFAHQFYKIINCISDADIVDGARDFRLMKRKMVDAIISMTEYNRFSKGIFGWVGFKTCWLPYENIERVAGKTKWSFRKLFKYALDGIVNFSETPLVLASIFGAVMSFVSFLFLIFIIVRKLIFEDPVAGWASTICIIIFIGGIQLLCMGIMGHYIAKTYMESKGRPHFIGDESNIDNVKMMG